MDPYLEIEVTPLYSRDGMASQGKSVRIADEEKPGWWKEIGVVSANYLLVHNTRLKTVVDEIAARSPVADWKPRKAFFDGKRFVYALTSDSILAEVTPGDLVRFGLIGYNSYDGSRAVSVGMYAEHLVCSNGMTSELYFARFTFRHHQGSLNWDDETQRAFTTLMPGSKGRLTRFANTLHKLKSKELTIPDLRVLRKDHLNDLSVTLWGRVMDRYLSQEPQDAFGFLDACTATFWHSERESISDYRNNSYATNAMVIFANRLN
jgi:hypothetical protein